MKLVEFDKRKSKLNFQKHGIFLEDARLINWKSAVNLPDDRFSYDGEVRFLTYGFINARLYALAWTYRGNIVRAISLRKANKREIKKYETIRNTATS